MKMISGIAFMDSTSANTRVFTD
jgi:hypothetical protein